MDVLLDFGPEGPGEKLVNMGLGNGLPLDRRKDINLTPLLEMFSRRCERQFCMGMAWVGLWSRTLCLQTHYWTFFHSNLYETHFDLYKPILLFYITHT